MEAYERYHEDISFNKAEISFEPKVKMYLNLL